MINILEFVKQKKLDFQNLPKESKARNYMEEIAWKYLDQLNWQNETLFADYTLFWMKSRKYWLIHTPHEYENILKWGAKVGAHPKAIVKVFNKEQV